jgi:hypothetical protein
MRKMKLKNWVVYLLMGVNFIALIFMASDSKGLGEFILIHLISTLIFVVNSLIIIKYGKRGILNEDM